MKNSKKNLIFFNKNLNCIILKKHISCIYIYNKVYFFFFYINDQTICLNNSFNLFITNSIISINNIDSKKKIFNNIVDSLNSIYFKKFIFNGKNFKIKKKKNINFFFFNNSHIKVLFEKKNKLLKTSKTNFLILSNFLKTFYTFKFIKNLFKLNVFTKKGIKLNRELLIVKKIKKK